MGEVRYPEMRAEVVRAVTALADPGYQRRVWVARQFPHPKFFDDLDANLHVLFDDATVLPDPGQAVGTIVWAGEVPALAELGRVLGPLIDELGDVPQQAYLDHPRWEDVVRAASRAVAVMDADRSRANPSARPGCAASWLR